MWLIVDYYSLVFLFQRIKLNNSETDFYIKEKSNMALNASTFDFMPLIQGYPALKFGRSGMAREKVFYLSGI